MKTLTIVLILILILGIFTFAYTFIVLKTNLGISNPRSCEMKYLGDGWTQLDNCVKYKVNQDMFRKSKMIG